MDGTGGDAGPRGQHLTVAQGRRPRQAAPTGPGWGESEGWAPPAAAAAAAAAGKGAEPGSKEGLFFFFYYNYY